MKEINLSDLYKGNFYHICTNGTECPPIMTKDEDFRIATNYLAITSWRIGAHVLAYCLMSNHLHVLVACKDRAAAVRLIRTFKQLYSTYLLHSYGTTKILKGKDDSISLIDDIRYLRKCIAYILRNPICARACSRLEDYKWSSYSCHFSDHSRIYTGRKVSELKDRGKKSILRTRLDLSGCPYLIDEKGFITSESFIRHDLTEKAFMNSGKAFISHIGHCNDAQMEYEMSLKPLTNTTDREMIETVERLAGTKFGKTLSAMNSSEKCAIIKNLYFNNRTSIPQLARVLGLQRALIRKILSN